MKNEVTLGQLLDLIDKDRKSDELISLREDGTTVCTAMVCWSGWKALENRAADAIEAKNNNNLWVWLKDEKHNCDNCKYFISDTGECTFGNPLTGESADISSEKQDEGCDCWEGNTNE